MNFPVWELSNFGGGFWIAFIATVHVYIAHFAVGGGLFLVLTEMWAYKKENTEILNYVRKHTFFFLLLTMVAGGLTGVGIWFTISVLAPEATLELIRTFVFGWATEWVFFVCEIVALLIYYLTFGKMDRRNHVIMGWLYFIFAWLSLFVINGIIGFMLTPGNWLESTSFWDGFFNPSFWPALFFRTFFALTIAGLFGFLTATRVSDKKARESLIRYCAVWALVPLVLVVLTAPWYISVLPEQAANLFSGGSPEISTAREIFMFSIPLVVALGVLLVIRLPQVVRFGAALVIVLLGFVWFGSFEYMREASRRPYVIYEHIYSNGVPVAAVDEINEQGFLKTARWTMKDDFSANDRELFLKAGEQLFTFQCLSCHSIGGIMNDIKPQTEKFSLMGMETKLKGLGKINAYMPPFLGTDTERKALAAYIVTGLHGKEARELDVQIEELELEIPGFEPGSDEYVLVAWNDLGMHCMTNTGTLWLMLPPANTLQAQLIRRGELPELVTEGVELRYKAEEGFRDPAAHTAFWQNSEALFGKRLERNVGLTGNGLTGTMVYDDELGAWVADKIPILPYKDDGSFNPYPLVTITAVDATTGEPLMATKVVAPTSTETGCANCHGGELTQDGVVGISDQAAEDVLLVHDRISGTNLHQRATSGDAVLCQECHSDWAMGMEGKEDVLSLSASIHGFHANYMTDMGSQACNSCHPSDPNGYTQCMRGVHNDMGLACTDCHGALEDHALTLLKGELNAGKGRAAVLMEHIQPQAVDSVEDINPRRAWIDQPDCLACHENYEAPLVFSSFNQWTTGAENLYRNSKGDMDALYCSACHGSPHALYPATNPYGEDRDVIQPLQYQQNRRPLGAGGNCSVCHVVELDWLEHHVNTIQ